MKKTLLVISFLVFATSACSPATPQTGSTNQSYPNQSYPNQPQTTLPLTEADVPRITVEETKLALNNGEAILVDVRSAESYAETHIAGAISIPLTGIENNPVNVPLDKNRWIITYCT